MPKRITVNGTTVSEKGLQAMTEIRETGYYVAGLVPRTSVYGDPIKHDTNMENALIAKGLIARVNDTGKEWDLVVTPAGEELLDAYEKLLEEKAEKAEESEEDLKEKRNAYRRDYNREYRELRRRRGL